MLTLRQPQHYNLKIEPTRELDMFSPEEVARMKEPRSLTLRDMRMEQRLSQTAIAERVGVRQPTINGWETSGAVGKESAMALGEDQLHSYYEALKTNPKEFVAALPDAVTLSGLSRETLMILMTAYVENKKNAD